MEVALCKFPRNLYNSSKFPLSYLHNKEIGKVEDDRSPIIDQKRPPIVQYRFW